MCERDDTRPSRGMHRTYLLHPNRWKDIQPDASLGNAKDGWDVDEDWVLYWRMEQSVDVVLVEIRRGGDRIS